MHKVLLIIPAYNEQDQIKKTVANLKKIISTKLKINSKNSCKVDYIVINDGSTDSTEKVLQKNNINHIKLFENLGPAGAVKTGCLYAAENGYTIIVQFDGDGQHSINSLKDLITPIILDKADFTVGSRYLQSKKIITSENNENQQQKQAKTQKEIIENNFQSTKLRQLGIKFLSKILKATTRTRVQDVTSGYRAGNNKVIDLMINRYPRRYEEPEMLVYLAKRNIRIQEVPVRMFERETGSSFLTPISSIGYMLNTALSMIFNSLVKQRKNENKE